VRQRYYSIHFLPNLFCGQALKGKALIGRGPF